VKGKGTDRERRALHPVSVTTGLRLSAPAERVWEGLMFYEHIPQRPPLALRLVLPAPQRAEGHRSSEGDETRCLYERGHLLKRTTRIDRWRHYGFQVVEQELAIGHGIRLIGGGYDLRELSDGTTKLELETRYFSPRWPRWLWGPFEAAVCHAFHRYILGAIRRQIEVRCPPEVSGGVGASEQPRPRRKPAPQSVAAKRP
jgi:hypothetical protein